LMWPDVPVRELCVLASDERVEKHRRDQRVGASHARWIVIEPVLEDPLVRIAVWPRLETFRALPVEHLVIGREYRRRPGNDPRKVVDERRFGDHLRRVACRRRRRSELTWGR